MSDYEDLGDGCIHCRRSTEPGKGLFIDRYAAGPLDPFGEGIEYEGFCCRNCEADTYEDMEFEIESGQVEGPYLRVNALAAATLEREMFGFAILPDDERTFEEIKTGK